VWLVAVAVAVYVVADRHEPGSVQLIVAPDDVTPETAPRAGVVSASVGEVIDVVEVDDQTAIATPAPNVTVAAVTRPTTIAVRDFNERNITRSR